MLQPVLQGSCAFTRPSTRPRPACSPSTACWRARASRSRASAARPTAADILPIATAAQTARETRNDRWPLKARTTAPAAGQIRLGMVGGGEDAFIGAVHRIAARLDDHYELVAGALSSTPEKAHALRARRWGSTPDADL